jgi:NTP pyrophosphatase (non-canonical NTP hydrolase)
MTQQIDLNKYSQFVEAVTSKESNDTDAMINRIKELQNQGGVNISLLLTAAVGLAAEAGEFVEIVKKIIFQGKELSEDNVYHMVRELGDQFWYWTNACRALDVDPNVVINENINKLSSRYPGGTFDAYYSENRKDGDI